MLSMRGIAKLHTLARVDTTGPSFLSAGAVSVAENAVLAHIIRTHETASIAITGGADAAQCEIVQSPAPAFQATLRWASNGTQDFEIPADADANNTYVVIVTATDTASNTSTQTITITVTDVTE